MKKIIKKKQWVIITVLSLTTGWGFMGSSGCKESPIEIYTNGTVIGYVKCYDNPVGFFIITEKQDSLLSFNVNPYSINVDTTSLFYPGAYNMDGRSISFDYRIAVGEEVKQDQDIICFQLALLPIFSGGPIENYTQIIVTDVK